ncbi:MAG: hypothetical protein M0004_05860 [Actinomycetota bacterium]|nr:hypothetical protein [Actinomycetota bacterium]
MIILVLLRAHARLVGITTLAENARVVEIAALTKPTVYRVPSLIRQRAVSGFVPKRGAGATATTTACDDESIGRGEFGCRAAATTPTGGITARPLAQAVHTTDSSTALAANSQQDRLPAHR